MAKKHERMYECDECKNKFFLRRYEFSRAASPKCPKCGCSRIEIVSAPGKREVKRIGDLRHSGITGMSILRAGK